MKKLLAVLFTLSILFTSPTFSFVSDAASISTAISNAGVTTGTEGDMSELYKDANSVVLIIISLSLIWAIGWIVIGGAKLSGSAGNSQKRAEGIGSIAMAAVGIFVIYKAYDIATWATSLGGTA